MESVSRVSEEGEGGGERRSEDFKLLPPEIVIDEIVLPLEEETISLGESTLPTSRESLRNWYEDEENPDKRASTLRNTSERELIFQQAAYEIYVTEVDYVNDLRTILESFVAPIQKQGLLKDETVQRIFGNLPMIYEGNKKLLEEMEKCREESFPKFVGMEKIFKKQSQMLYLYSENFCNYHRSLELLTSKIQNKPKLAAFLEHQRQEGVMHGMPLKFLLLKPFQRVTKYPMLLKRLLETAPKSYDTKELAVALKEIEAVVKSLNEEKRARENHEKIIALKGKIKAEKNFDLGQKGQRIFVREGRFSEVSWEDPIRYTKKGELFLFLFEDVLLVTRKAQFFDEYRLRPNDVIPLSSLVVKVDTIPPESETIFYIGRQPEKGEKGEKGEKAERAEKAEGGEKEKGERERGEKAEEAGPASGSSEFSYFLKASSEADRNSWVESLQDDDDDSEDEDNLMDPFDTHFAHPDDDTVAKRVKAVQKGEWATKRALIQNLRATVTYPSSDAGSEVPKPMAGLDGLSLKQKLKETAARKIGEFDAAQRAFSPLLFNYSDVLHCDRTVRNSDSLRKLTCLHALNHVFKTRDRVIKNNYKLAKEGQDTELELRDQGFTRPKVLFLLPTRNSCLRIVNIIRDLCEPDQQENRKRFEEGYVDKEAKFGDDRPADFRDLFEGSDDDMFRLGMKFTRKTIKYFSQFYNSDILFASPLGLRMAIGSEEDKKLDFDFLSSIEMVVVDQADALLMQNWEHVEFIFEHLNLQPKDAHGCDFSRVRNWYLEDWAKYFRQTIVLSAFNTPELSELLRLHCHNWAGKVRLQPEYPGSLSQLGVKLKQTFSRFQSSSVDKDPDARFEYFTSAIVPSLAKRAKDATGTLIFIPSYLDFVRVRNYFATSTAVENVTFGAISEYADVPEASRARSHFLNGRHRVLLYTERAHHFRRYQLRGVQRVIFYGLPDNPIFYNEIAGGYLSKSEQDMRLEPGQGSVKVVFSKYDVMKLERIVGSKRVGKMIQERGDTFEFI